MKTTLTSLALALFCGTALAQAPAQKPVPPAKISAHAQKDAQRHRAMAVAHESAARCYEAGKTEDQCQAELQVACKGLALGKYCGMRHEH